MSSYAYCMNVRILVYTYRDTYIPFYENTLRQANSTHCKEVCPSLGKIARSGTRSDLLFHLCRKLHVVIGML